MGIIGGKDAVILNVQQDEPTESSGLKSEHSAGGFAFVCLQVLMIVIFILHFPVLTADEGVVSAVPKQSPTQGQNHDRSGGHEEALLAKPSHLLAEKEPEDPHEDCQEGGQSLVSLSLTTATSHQSKQEERVSDIAPSTGSTNSPPSACCKWRTLDLKRADEAPEDAGDQEEDLKSVNGEENSSVGVSSLAVGSLREQVEAESRQEAEPSEEPCQVLEQKIKG